jgi:hypothetical protein
MTQTASIQSRTDFKDDPSGQYKYWNEEITGALTRLRRWHKQGDRIVKRFLDFRGETDGGEIADGGGARLNLFHSNVVTLQSMLYGNVPTVDVSRRYADPNDDVSRVAAEIMERLLNNDIQDDNDGVTCVLRACLQDRLLPGLACARVRYEMETKQETAAEGETEGLETLAWEDAPVDYFHWRDVLWGWSRTWSQIPWIAYRSWMNKDEVTARFGENIAKNLTYTRQSVNDNRDTSDEPDLAGIWQKAEIWEIWDKVKRKVVFYSAGYDKTLESRDDPLQLSGFFPSPPFFLANQTTSIYQPTPDFHLARNLYNEIDVLQTRIEMITSAVKVIGVYDASAGDSVGRMFKEGVDNQLIPVDSWALFAEKGGLEGSIQWLPLADIVAGLDKLRELRGETIELLYQVTGLADVLRGGGAGQYEGTGQAALKAKFASIRVQALQEEFATFASNLLAIKAEIICRHFSPQTIAMRANIERSFDADLAPQAIMLLKDPEMARLRVVIRPESVAMTDFAQLKQERTDYINAVSTFMQSAAPMIEQDPSQRPFLMQLLQWGLSGFKGSQQIEGVMDKAIEAAQKKADQPQPPDPALAAQQGAMQLEQMRAQTKMSEIQAKAQADMQLRQQDKDADIQTMQAEHDAKMRETQFELQSALAQTAAKMQADVMVEQAKSQANALQNQQQVQGELIKDTANHEMDMQKAAAQTQLKILELSHQHVRKITEVEKQAELKPEPKNND